MKRAIVIAIDAALGAFLVAGCATKGPPQAQIKPVLEVRHSGLQADGYYQLGRFLQLQHRYDEAADAYRKALALDPNSADAHNGLGTLAALGGRYEEAHREFNAALAITPDNTAVLNNIGYAYVLELKKNEAAVAFERAAAIDPGNARYQANLSLASNNQAPGSVQALVAAAPATFDAVQAPLQPAGSPVISTASETDSVRLVAIGPNAFELVVPTPRAREVTLAALPTSRTVHVAVEVANGNGAAGMARRVGRQLASAGVTVKRLTNHVPYGQVSSQVQYRPGHENEALALSWRVPGRPPVIASVGLRSGIDVRLVLGRELPADVALLSPAQLMAQLDIATTRD